MRWIPVVALVLVVAATPVLAAEDSTDQTDGTDDMPSATEEATLGESAFGTTEADGLTWTFIDTKVLLGSRESRPEGLFENTMALGPFNIGFTDGILVFAVESTTTDDGGEQGQSDDGTEDSTTDGNNDGS